MLLAVIFLTTSALFTSRSASAQTNPSVRGTDAPTRDRPTSTSPPPNATGTRAQNQLTVRTSAGDHRFTVEIADDPIERQRGLMFRTELARDAGMLFDFAAEGERSFWMRNTILPLDIIYARTDGTVVSIARDTTPFSLASIPSNGPARFVLEVNAGVADEIGLQPGDTLIHDRVER